MESRFHSNSDENSKKAQQSRKENQPGRSATSFPMFGSTKQPRQLSDAITRNLTNRAPSGRRQVNLNELKIVSELCTVSFRGINFSK